MNCYAEIHDISDEKVMQMAGNIYNTTLDILNKSEMKIFLLQSQLTLWQKIELKESLKFECLIEDI